MNLKVTCWLAAALIQAWLPTAQAKDSIDPTGREVVVIDRPVASVFATQSAKVILRKGAEVSHFFARDSTEVTIEGGAHVTFMHFMGRKLTVVDGRFQHISVYERAEAHIHRIEISGDAACAAGVGDWGGGLAYAPGTRVHLYADILAFNAGVVEGVWRDGRSFSLGLMEKEAFNRPICKRPKSMPVQLTVHEIPGPSFDCSRATLRAEKLVCSTPSLAKLDKDLARAYRQAHDTAQDPGALAREQRRWLAGRNKCADNACLEAAYEARSRSIAESGMTNDKAKGMCQSVVAAINDGSIRQKFVAFERDEKLEWQGQNGLTVSGVVRARYKGRDRTFVTLYGGGSCATCSIVDLHAKEQILEPPDDDDQRLRWAGWGNCDHLLWVNGEAVVVTGRFGDQYIRATLVSWIDAEGTVRPLCYLGSTGEAETRIVKSENDGLCRAVLDGRGEEPPWDSMSIAEGSRSSGRFIAREGQVAALDLDQDGTRDYIARMSYDSGGGCGGHFEWFAHVAKLKAQAPEPRGDPEEEARETLAEDELPGEYAFQDSALGRWLSGLPGGGLLEHVPGTPVKMNVLTYEGKPYVLSGGSSSTAQVVSFWGGAPKTWCEYRILPKHAVEVFYPVETWPKAAGK